jgi:hypothetical protein
MSDFFKISADFLHNRNSVCSNVRSVVYEESKSLLLDFKDRAPVDSGEFKSNWKLSKKRFSDKNTLVNFTLSNDSEYSVFMDLGAEKNKAPWFYPGKKKKRSGKLKIVNGRVWAGGVNPGHNKTVYGAINPVIFHNQKRINKLVNSVADSVIKGLK